MSLLAGLREKRDELELARAVALVLGAFEGTVELEVERPAA